MSFWTWFFIVLAALIALFLIVKVRVFVRYERGQFALHVGLGVIKRRILTGKPKKERPEKEEKQKREAHTRPKKQISEYVDFGLTLLEKLKKLLSKVVVEDLSVSLLFAGDDPAKTVLSYGYASAVCGMAIPVLENTFNIRKKRIELSYTFDEDAKQEVSGRVVCSLRFSRFLRIAVSIVYAILKFMKEE